SSAFPGGQASPESMLRAVLAVATAISWDPSGASRVAATEIIRFGLVPRFQSYDSQHPCDTSDAKGCDVDGGVPHASSEACSHARICSKSPRIFSALPPQSTLRKQPREQEVERIYREPQRDRPLGRIGAEQAGRDHI